MTFLRGGAPAPSNPFALLPLRRGVLMPGAQLTLTVGRQRSTALVRSLHVGDLVGVIAQLDNKVEDPLEVDLHRVGTYAHVLSIGRRGDGAFQLTVEGVDRFRLVHLESSDPFLRGNVELLSDENAHTEESRLLVEALSRQLEQVVQGGSLSELIAKRDEPGLFADRVSAALGLETEEAMEVLATADVAHRLRRVIDLAGRAKTRSELRRKIEEDVRSSFGERQREAVLREQLAAIRKELGDDDDDALAKLRAKLDAAGLTPDAREVADRELRRLENNSAGAEANVIRNYLEWLAALPWTARAESEIGIDAISAQLEADHYGLEDVKKRILEHMAVQRLGGKKRGTILCLVGPPGVGKTSLGQSVAKAIGRPFVRVALGGVRDEAEIRGHRRTYVGALPGRIVHGLRQAKVKNPVMLLDELDKLGTAGYAGWPEAALLEVLDPEQNGTFTDHYLELPFDLSEVMFIATANNLDTLSAPLRDRLEIIELSGYTYDEKAAIARRHLIPKRVADHGIPEGVVTVTDDGLARLIAAYTREAGVRQLDRELSRLCRSAALEVARAKADEPVQLTFDAAAVEKQLGKPRFQNEVAERTSVPGVATGLAWTPFGGDILFIETSRMPGKGSIEITGQLGDVMKESARAALTYVRSHAAQLGIDPSVLDKQDLHIHVPAGATPKDGPSAGVTMFTALSSLLTGRKVRSDTAMTGEATLRGRVLPVGGIKAKVLAAHRAGIRRVILPARNARDWDEVPEVVRAELELHLVEDMLEVLRLALEEEPTPVPVSADVEGRHPESTFEHSV